MIEQDDELRTVLNALVATVPANISHDPALEKRLMNEATSQRSATKRRRTMIAATCILVAIGGTTVVAAGGVEAIRNWFATAAFRESDGTTTYQEIPESGVLQLDETHELHFVPDPGEKLEGQTIFLFPADPDEQPNDGAERPKMLFSPANPNDPPDETE